MSAAASSRWPAASACCAPLWLICATHPAMRKAITHCRRGKSPASHHAHHHSANYSVRSHQTKSRRARLNGVSPTTIHSRAGVASVEERDLLSFASDDNRCGRETLQRGQIFSIRDQHEAFVRGPQRAQIIVVVDKACRGVRTVAERRQLASIGNQRFAKSGVEGNRVHVVPIRPDDASGVQIRRELLRERADRKLSEAASLRAREATPMMSIIPSASVMTNAPGRLPSRSTINETIAIAASSPAIRQASSASACGDLLSKADCRDRDRNRAEQGQRRKSSEDSPRRVSIELPQLAHSQPGENRERRNRGQDVRAELGARNREEHENHHEPDDQKSQLRTMRRGVARRFRSCAIHAVRAARKRTTARCLRSRWE